jgi:tetratricopeptide (TPR) repeat protein
MFRVLAILLIAANVAAQTMPQENISDALTHAQALYYEARFNDSIQLLNKVNDVLRGKPDMQAEKVSTKLQLALAHIGLNQMAEARTYLLELYAIDPDHTLDSKQYSPKVIEMAGVAKAEQSKLRCQTALFDARKHLESGNANAVVTLIDTMKPRCSNLSSIEPEAADLQYKTGLAAYRRNDFTGAVKHFKTAVRLSPTHELAAQYIDLTQSKLQVAEDRLLLQWQKNFDSRQLRQAAADYQQILGSESNPQAAAHVNGEYRRALTTLVDEWNRACPTGDETALQGIRGQINDLLPTPSFGEDIRGRMTGNCVKPAPKPDPAPMIVAATPSAAPLDIALVDTPARRADGPLQ